MKPVLPTHPHSAHHHRPTEAHQPGFHQRRVLSHTTASAATAVETVEKALTKESTGSPLTAALQPPRNLHLKGHYPSLVVVQVQKTSDDRFSLAAHMRSSPLPWACSHVDNLLRPAVPALKDAAPAACPRFPKLPPRRRNDGSSASLRGEIETADDFDDTPAEVLALLAEPL